MKHESCQNSVKSMKHCALPPHPPLQINRKVRKASILTKLKQNHTHDLIKAMQRDDENTRRKHPQDNKSFKTSFLDL